MVLKWKYPPPNSYKLNVLHYQPKCMLNKPFISRKRHGSSTSLIMFSLPYTIYIYIFCPEAINYAMAHPNSFILGQSGWNESLASKATNHEPTLLLVTGDIPFAAVFGLRPRPWVTSLLVGFAKPSFESS